MSINVGLTSNEEFSCIVDFLENYSKKSSKRIKNKTKMLLYMVIKMKLWFKSLIEAKDFFEKQI